MKGWPRWGVASWLGCWVVAVWLACLETRAGEAGAAGSVADPGAGAALGAGAGIGGKRSPVTALAYAPDGRLLVSGASRVVAVHGVGDGVIRRRVAVDLANVGGLAFAPGGEALVAAGGVPGEVGRLVWLEGMEGDAGRVRGVVDIGGDVLSAVGMDAQGERLAAAGMDGVVRWWKVEGGTPPSGPAIQLKGHTGPVLAVVFAPDGRRLLTAGADRTVSLWDLGSGRRERSLSMHTDRVLALALRPARVGVGAEGVGETWECASAGDDRTVRVWQPAIGRMVRIVRGHGGSVLALGYGPGGGVLYSLGREGVLRCFESGSDVLKWERRVGGDWGYALAASPDGRWVATGDALGEVRVTAVELE